MGSRLAGKVAVVTGGGSGIGAATCALFAAEGAEVVVADLFPDAVAASLGARPARLDVRDADALDALAADVGPVDVLVTSAGGVPVGTERAVWDETLAVLLTGTWLAIRAVLPGMVARGAGSVVTVGSVAGLTGVRGLSPYSAAKGGVIALTRQVAAEHAAAGVRANVVCPGLVPTPFAEATLAGQVAAGLKTPRTYAEGLAGAAEHYPLGRLGTPQDVAHLVLYLAGDESSWVTGQVFAVDGGLTG